jgi:hypothetical protein
VSAVSFPGKTLFELVLIKTAARGNQEWIDCKFHADYENAPAEFLDNAESPMTLYFALEDANLELDVRPRKQIKGPKPKDRTVKMNPGDILLFDTCRCIHWTTKPTEKTTPVRVNIVMTGIEKFINEETVSIASSESEYEL